MYKSTPRYFLARNGIVKVKNAHLFSVFSVLFCTACQTLPDSSSMARAQASQEIILCKGDTSLPDEWAGKLTPISDPEKEKQALELPGKGGLCIAQAYQVNANTDLTIYRAWNSTNPNSRLGQWWASARPSGLVSEYREDFEICYQWSPLDKLVSCKLAPGSKVVIGTGQSAVCSEYLTYPVSAAKQIFILDAGNKTSECEDFDAVMGWVTSPQPDL